MPSNPHRGKFRDQGYTKTQQKHLERLMLHAAHLTAEDPMDYDVQDVVPVAWDTLERDVDVYEKKVKITLRLDESVAKFYRAMGEGYQARMNRILATFAQMRMGQLKLEKERLDAELRSVTEYVHEKTREKQRMTAARREAQGPEVG